MTADVVVAAWNDNTLRGLDADDGEKLWETRLDPGCEAEELAGDVTLVVAEVRCEKKRYLESYDPDTGESNWQVPVSIEAEKSVDDLDVHGDAVIIRFAKRLLVLDATGRTLLDAPTTERVSPQVVTTEDIAVVAYTDKADGDVVTAIARQDAKPRWRRQLAVSAMRLAQGRLFALGPLPEPLLPAGLYEIDQATGRMTVSPTHLLVPDFQSLATVFDDVAVTYHWQGEIPRTSVLSGYRLTPAPSPVGIAGGGPAESWPGACELLTTDEVAARATGVSYEAKPQQTTIADMALPKPAQCRYEPSSVKAPVVSVGVAWSGTDPAQATELMADLRRQYADTAEVPGLGDEALRLASFDYPQPTVKLYIRVGARIARVKVPDGHDDLVRELAALAVARLAAT
ncbi:PQQ-binding-like beta-propeller repeat protein [Catellatospora bangladeshensis]|uniref:outer membrane protein assembly factor BamB family protein n=1 Tax=Catellatospora bangladeshensis TaxID=310355 RepID=UPI00361CDE31